MEECILYSTLVYCTFLYSGLLSSPLLSSPLLYSTLLYSTLLYSKQTYSTLLSSTLLTGALSGCKPSDASQSIPEPRGSKRSQRTHTCGSWLRIPRPSSVLPLRALDALWGVLKATWGLLVILFFWAQDHN